MSRLLVTGASGLVGSAALEHFLDSGWDVVAVSRRPPEITSPKPYEHIAVDLTDREASHAAFVALDGITHVVFAALYEPPSVRGWVQATDQIEVNGSMLRNTIDPLTESGELESVSILQGTKAYGIGVRSMCIPSRESEPRPDNSVFYWAQEDYLRPLAEEKGFRWNALRPQLVLGSALGGFANMPVVVGVYAAICKAKGEPCGFPGGASYVWEASDARLCASALEMMAVNPRADGQQYNVTNGDVFEWRNAWPGMMERMGVEAGEPLPRSMAEYLPANDDVWQGIVREHGLRTLSFDELLGTSHFTADGAFAYGAEEPPFSPAFLSSIKLRKAGVTDVYDTDEAFCYWISRLQERSILPRF